VGPPSSLQSSNDSQIDSNKDFKSLSKKMEWRMVIGIGTHNFVSLDHGPIPFDSSDRGSKVLLATFQFVACGDPICPTKYFKVCQYEPLHLSKREINDIPHQSFSLSNQYVRPYEFFEKNRKMNVVVDLGKAVYPAELYWNPPVDLLAVHRRGE
jgi:hypothetical protein